jgi:hypothetical protein
MVRAGLVTVEQTLRAMDERCEELQRERLRTILEKNAGTEFGQAHGFGEIGSVEEYRRRVRPTTSADYHDGWERMAQGEQGVLCADRPQSFAVSSGTTGKPKLIPLTKALVKGFRHAIGYTTACYMLRRKDYSLLRGYALQIAAPHQVSESEDGVPVGFITGVISASRSYPFHNIAVPPLDVMAIEDWREKYEIIEERYADHDIRMIFGVPGYVLGLLRLIAGRRGLEDFAGHWPDLKFVVTSGAALRSHRHLLEALCPGAELLEMYLATEGAIAFQPEDGAPGLKPLVEDVFFEFVPEDRWDEEDPPRAALWEVEADVPYVPLLTTPAGLYAYSPGDVVRFVGVDPPRMVVEGRQGHLLNLTTEKVDELVAERAFARAGLEHEAFSGFPSAGPELSHEWVVEFRGPPPPDAAERLDTAIAELNPNYGIVRRGDAVLAPPLVTAVRPGTFLRALERRQGQAKILRIYGDRAVRDELVELSER